MNGNNDFDHHSIAFLCRSLVASAWYYAPKGREVYYKARELVAGDRAEREFWKGSNEDSKKAGNNG